MKFKTLKLTVTFIAVSLAFQVRVHAQAGASVETKVNSMLKGMTLEEKVGQMAQIAIDVLGSGSPFQLNASKVNDAIVNYKVGSVLNAAGTKALAPEPWYNIISVLQAETQKTRMKIPVIYGLDHIHGTTYIAGGTFFPQQIAQAATWNRKLVHDGAVITAYESRAANVPWSFSPVLDLGINPLWPRLWETLGEDPYLVSELGVQYIKGLEQPLGNKEKIASSLKHFMGYSDPKSGKDRTNAWIPEHYLREYFLPPFRAAVKAGARTVMVNSSLINGVPAHINKHLLTDILKNELGFTGLIVTDWQDIENIHRRDKIAKSNKEALMLAINAGIDMSMIPYNYKEFCNDLVALVKEGKVPMSRIDDATKRVLRVKYELDLFNTPNTRFQNYPKFGSAEFEKVAYNTAAESITLLKNSNNILPLAKNSKVLVTGPNANSMRTLNGGWSYSWQGEKVEEFAQKYNTILEAITGKFNKENVVFEEGVAYKMKGKYFEDSIVSIDAAVHAASGADYILLCVGENSYAEKPGDLNDLSLSDNQIALAQALIKTGKPVILILNEGRPRIISKIEPGVAAILNTYLPGNHGADALADILIGNINPSGKLPITYPRYTNALTNYLHKPSDAQSNPQGAYDYSADFNPQYEFGYGLSYSTFGYSDLKINKTSFLPGENISISINVTNTGNREGKEIVQLFISDLFASLTPDVKRLRGFEKVDLKPGESRVVEFKVPVKELAFVNLGNKMQLEEGEFKVQVGNQKVNFTLTKGQVFDLQL